LNDPSLILPLIGLYAETHYRFRFFPFSRYFRREPEIIFDAPFRVEPAAPIPLTLLIKDAHRYPIELEEISVALHSPASGELVERRIPLDRAMECSFWFDIFDLDVGHLPPGELLVKATLSYRVGKRRRRATSDNHPGLSHAPLRVFKAADPLPLLPGWIAGELHSHTSYGADYVEFGAPLEAIKRTAEALGHSFAAITDHSYNLDDLPDDYLNSDPDVVKWELLQEESARLNRKGGAQILAGEELSCRSSRGRNVHLIILGNREFLHGAGDGAERWFRTRSEFSVAEALDRIAPEAFAAAAHPLVPTPPLEWLLIRRGEWTGEDLLRPRLDGWQIANGDWGIDFQRGFAYWQERVKSGGPIPRLYGGNDAHGNFNRFRQVRLPMIRLVEGDRNVFGRVSTRLKSSASNSDGIIAALKSAPLMISDGPSIDLEPAAEGMVKVVWKSTEEFGAAASIRLFSGANGKVEPLPAVDPGGHRHQGEILQKISPVSFIGAELVTETKLGERRRALLNPVPIALLLKSQGGESHGK